ncbi:hypothetical protein PV458_05515 [Streptomyces sp. MN03-5084-2B]|nr:hypothetical protein [Streptomyces sp. MN03-5084-2B]
MSVGDDSMEGMQGEAEGVSERDRLIKRYNDLYAEIQTWTWTIGPWKMRKQFGSGFVTKTVLIWHVAALLAGILVTLLWKDDRGLGVALIVGALFGLGAFLSQVWSQAMDREREFIHKVENEDNMKEMRALLVQLGELDGGVGKVQAEM